MNNDIAIKLDNVGKLYKLGEIGTGTISHDLNRWYARIRKREDPFVKIGSASGISEKTNEYVWALQNINLEIKKGEIVGIIGKNGAGKSTILKLLSKVTKPTKGKVFINGSIASLLEVGTGFHPEMTGRENIFLNGAILGMTRNEIKRKFDQIVDFSGVGQYIDTPVKRYSSGMYVRLGFAIAAHLEPDILIVDEVLAVGDAEFQKRCIGKMKDVSVNDGRTVLFVSHNMSAIQSLCTTGALLEKGSLKKYGIIESIIESYKKSYEKENVSYIEDFSEFNKITNPLFIPLAFGLVDTTYKKNTIPIRADKEVFIKIVFESKSLNPFLKIGIMVYNELDEIIFMSFHNDKKDEFCPPINIGGNEFLITIPKHFLNEGNYKIELLAHIEGMPNFWKLGYGPQIVLTISGGLSEGRLWIYKRRGILAPVLDFKNLKHG